MYILSYFNVWALHKRMRACALAQNRKGVRGGVGRYMLYMRVCALWPCELWAELALYANRIYSACEPDDKMGWRNCDDAACISDFEDVVCMRACTCVMFERARRVVWNYAVRNLRALTKESRGRRRDMADEKNGGWWYRISIVCLVHNCLRFAPRVRK